MIRRLIILLLIVGCEDTGEPLPYHPCCDDDEPTGYAMVSSNLLNDEDVVQSTQQTCYDYNSRKCQWYNEVGVQNLVEGYSGSCEFIESDLDCAEYCYNLFGDCPN